MVNDWFFSQRYSTFDKRQLRKDQTIPNRNNNVVCFSCNLPRHYSSQCGTRVKNIPLQKRYRELRRDLKEAQFLKQARNMVSMINSTSKPKGKRSCGPLLDVMIEDRLGLVGALVDTGCSRSIISDKLFLSLLSRVRKRAKPYHMPCLTANSHHF